MSDFYDRMPKKGEIWQHQKTGKTYQIEGASFNAGSDRVEVLYVPMYSCEYRFFTRPLFDHPKSFMGKNEDGVPRYVKVANGQPHRQVV